MSPSRLKLIVDLIALAAMAGGCATPDSERERAWFFGGEKTARNFSEQELVDLGNYARDYESGIKNDFRQKTLLDNDSLVKKSRSIRSTICKSDKAIKASLTVLLPSPSKGLPLDEAQLKRKEYLEKARWFTKHSFFSTAPAFMYSVPDGTDVSKLFGRIKGYRIVPESMSDGELHKHQVEQIGDRVVSRDNYAFSGTSNLIVIGDRRSRQFFGGFFRLGKSSWGGTNNSDQYKEISILKSNNKVVSLVGEGFNPWFGEITLLRAFYTFVPPEKKDISELLKRRNDYWDEYLDQYTETSEKTLSPDAIRFDARLDLSRFCDYGRHVNDLVSK
jgi:hypothetical protein